MKRVNAADDVLGEKQFLHMRVSFFSAFFLEKVFCEHFFLKIFRNTQMTPFFRRVQTPVPKFYS